jgi:hypothetical protein
VGDEERETDEDRLNERDADDSLSHCADRGGAEPRKAFASLGADDALENRSTRTRPRLAVRHHDASDDE